MAVTYKLITSYTVPSAVSTVTLGSIPSTYDNLILKCSLRSTYSAVTENFYTYFNSTDSGSLIMFRGDGAGSAFSFAAGDSFKGSINAANSGTNVFSNVEFYIPNYKKTDRSKVMNIDNMTEYAGSGNVNSQEAVSLWAPTAAITSISFRLQFSTYAANSKFYLYGTSNS